MPELAIQVRDAVGPTEGPGEQLLELFHYKQVGGTPEAPTIVPTPRGIMRIPAEWLETLQEAGQVLEILTQERLRIRWYRGAERLELKPPDAKLVKAVSLARKFL